MLIKQHWGSLNSSCTEAGDHGTVYFVHHLRLVWNQDIVVYHRLTSKDEHRTSAETVWDEQTFASIVSVAQVQQPFRSLKSPPTTTSSLQASSQSNTFGLFTHWTAVISTAMNLGITSFGQPSRIQPRADQQIFSSRVHVAHTPM